MSSGRRMASSRRSNRINASISDNLAEEEFSDSSSGSSSDDDVQRRSKASAEPMAVRGKASCPAYGHFRSIAELGFDPYDEETVDLRAHRYICVKCHREPTHVLLEKARKSKNKGRKKHVDEGESEDDDTDLGGWVRWYVSATSKFDHYMPIDTNHLQS